MNLKYPKTDIDFIVSPAYFLGDFDIYDREQTLEKELNKLDPNNNEDLLSIFNKYFFESGRIKLLTTNHKMELLRVLKNALDNENEDFLKYLDPNDPNDIFLLPNEWNIEEPRLFFSKIYELVKERWCNE